MTRTTRMRNVEQEVEDVYDSSSTVASNGLKHFVRSLFWSAFFFIGLWFWRAVNSLSDSFLDKDFNSTPSSSSLCRGDYRHSYIRAIRKGYRPTSDRQSTISEASSKNPNEIENPDVYAAGPSVSNEPTGGAAVASTNLERFMTLIENPSTEDSGVDSEDDVFAPPSTRRWVSLPPERIRRKKKQTRIRSEDRAQPRHYLDPSNIDEQAPGFNTTRFHDCSGGDMTVLYVNNIYVNHPQSLSISQVQHLACQTGGFGTAAYTTIGASRSNTYADVYSQATDAAWV